MFTVFVPAHVNRDSIPACFVDTNTTFIDVETEQQAIEQRSASEDPFFVFETGYFTIHNVPDGPMKCDYISRNYIMQAFFYGGFSAHHWRALSERNGLKFNSEPPVLYFVHEDNIGDIHGNATEDNTIVHYYKEKNLEQFAEITKTTEGCCNHCFIVYKDETYQCVDSSNIDNSYTFSEALKWKVISTVRKNIAAINDLNKVDRKFRKRQPPRRLLNGEFRLRNEDGDEVADGEQFSFIIPRDDDEEEESDDEYEPEQDGINVSNGALMANPGRSDVFSCETIDGILYLTHNGQYLCCPDDGMNDIRVSPELPEPSDRLQINYDGNDIMFTRWGGSVFAMCEWVKASVGCIGFYNDDYSQRYKEPMRLWLLQ
ncbi:hypothetical protein DL89DRAFT_268579, partial [Linderina pennispora]